MEFGFNYQRDKQCYENFLRNVMNQLSITQGDAQEMLLRKEYSIIVIKKSYSNQMFKCC